VTTATTTEMLDEPWAVAERLLERFLHLLGEP